MLLAIDIGNSHIVIGGFRGAHLSLHFRLATDLRKTEDEYGLLLKSLLGQRRIKGVALASVVPILTEVLRRATERHLGLDALVVTAACMTGLQIPVEAETIGADRLANMVAAYTRLGSPVMIADFGTATTLTVVGPRGQYLGGAIAPGLATCAEALTCRTAQLPPVPSPLSAPSTVIGRDTRSAIESGLFWGQVGLIEEIMRRLKKAMKTAPLTVVATGGFAEQIAPACPSIAKIEPHLTLIGLRLIYSMNRPGKT